MKKFNLVDRKAYKNFKEIVDEFEANEPVLNQIAKNTMPQAQKQIDAMIRSLKDGLMVCLVSKLPKSYKIFCAANIRGGKSTLLNVVFTKECKIDNQYRLFTAARIYTNGGTHSEVVFFTDNFRQLLKDKCHSRLEVALSINKFIDNKISIILNIPNTLIYHCIFYYGIAIGRKEDDCLVFYKLYPINDLNELLTLVGKLSSFAAKLGKNKV